jgi:hypothetical protein
MDIKAAAAQVPAEGPGAITAHDPDAGMREQPSVDVSGIPGGQDTDDLMHVPQVSTVAPGQVTMGARRRGRGPRLYHSSPRCGQLQRGPTVMVAVRMAASALATWAALIVLLVAPAPLPEQWRYYIYSPASVGLWMFAMFVAPIVVCAVKWPWIKSGGR